MRIEIDEDRVTIIHDLKDDAPGHIAFCKVPSCRRLADLTVDRSGIDQEPCREYYCHYCFEEELAKED
jgi:hypothetical protein